MSLQYIIKSICYRSSSIRTITVGFGVSPNLLTLALFKKLNE
jgi:hypothetical protein